MLRFLCFFRVSLFFSVWQYVYVCVCARVSARVPVDFLFMVLVQVPLVEHAAVRWWGLGSGTFSRVLGTPTRAASTWPRQGRSRFHPAGAPELQKI